LGYLHLVPFAAHIFEEDCDMELAAARYFKSRVISKVDTQPYVYLKLSHKALADLARIYILAFAASKRPKL